jgi:hypothetical protein
MQCVLHGLGSYDKKGDVILPVFKQWLELMALHKYIYIFDFTADFYKQ